MEPAQKISIFWFRRDLRLHDNAGLYQALRSGTAVLTLFIFDRDILDKLGNPADKRVQFIHQEVLALKHRLEHEFGSSMLIRYGKPLDVWRELKEKIALEAVYCNRDYEPYARQRDKEIYDLLLEEGVEFRGFKDQVIFDRREIVKADGSPYQVFTPYMKQHRAQLEDKDLCSYPTLNYSDAFFRVERQPAIELEEMGFKSEPFTYPGRDFPVEVIKQYQRERNFPAREGTTRLSLHLRFGTISIRELARLSHPINDTFYNELVWRDFYQQILYHFPHTVESSFRPKYDQIPWDNNEEHFKRWCEGSTGYPLVDAGMRQLNQTGFMHNRVRMLVASFLTKHLLIDWRWGEAYFAEKLLDYDAASNIGGWQWAASSGVDASPYFRVFNPGLQLDKFDKQGDYVSRYVPEWKSAHYPAPIVEHQWARQRAIDTYKKALA